MKTQTAAMPEQSAKHEFGRRIQTLLHERNWNQAELARAAALGRDSISTYIKGTVFPDPKNLKKIADAFGLTPQALMPAGVPTSAPADLPMLEIRQSASDPDKVHIRINRLVTFEQATKIFSIINQG
jgi:transcriptional regulator with XRE-family HTH domain